MAPYRGYSNRRRSKGVQDAQCQCIVGILFIYGVFAAWAWVNGAFHDEGWAGVHHNSTSDAVNGTLGNSSLPLANITTPSNATGEANPACTDANWSPGSAFFTIIALTFGYFAHPRGSSVYRDSGRMWRLSPLFALNETCVLLVRIVSARRSQASDYSMREIAYALLAIRVGNAWSQEEYGMAVEELAAQEQKKLEAGQPTQSLHPSPGLRPAQTWPKSTQKDQDANPTDPKTKTHRSSPRDPLDQVELARWHSKVSRELFKKHLRIVDTFEHGPSIRVFVWIPMLLQIAKLLVVRGGASFAKSIGFVYFVAWLVVEILSIIVAKRPITAEEIQRATDLAQEGYHAPNWKSTGNPEYPIMKTSAAPVGNVLSIVHGVVNFFSLGRVLGFHGFGALFWSFLVFIPFTSPFPLILVAALASWFWRRLGLERWMGKLWYSALIPNISDADYFGVYPAFLALFSLVLEVLMFAGVGAAKDSFPCWTTRKPTWYDWLG